MISELMSVIGDGARTNKYRVIVNLPDSREIDILCQSTSLPGKTITPADVWYKGRRYQARGETQHNPSWSFTFYNQTDLKLRDEFWKWMNLVHNSKIGYFGTIENFIPQHLLQDIKNGWGNINEFINDIGQVIDDPMNFLTGYNGMLVPYWQNSVKIYQLDGNGNDTYNIELVGAFPIEISPIEYTDATGEISTTTITMAYTDIIIPDEETANVEPEPVPETY